MYRRKRNVVILMKSISKLLTSINNTISQRSLKYQSSKIVAIHCRVMILKYFHIRTWLISNTQLARTIGKRYHGSLQNIYEKVEKLKHRFHLRTVDFSDDWSVAQFYACLTTFFMYIDKWDQRLLSLKGEIFV